jgi:hypothetical protein
MLYLLFTYKQRRSDRLLWLIPPLMLVWGNLHAGFSIGFIFLAGMIAGETLGNVFNRGGANVIPPAGIRKLIIVGLVSAAALVVNPYGAQMLLVPFETVSIGPLRDFIQEWNSPNFQERQTWPLSRCCWACWARWARAANASIGRISSSSPGRPSWR